ncbi:ABC transporter substrate-binding protein [Aquamicrobium sp. NLF2-7]|uniref:ABC transporter substrate-binding protein n=1 Tax=Aquamicrobium TaxID=69278 RepID=UPI001EFAEFFC|nr:MULTISPECIES: ABC transporter substrate-binding protein [Aquamicrobium]MCG8273386.1 ABC transporter substrate-binding protein [Aquamicrobium sp. NLF2-7]MDH4989255.1 ABC transporter substrate-binding protein [Aquamicrobium lusatiense]
MKTVIACALACVLMTGVAMADPFRIIVTSKEAPLVPNSVLHLAQSEGYFERAGVDVELIPVEQTPMAVTALRTGGGEMANISVDSLLGLYTGGVTDLKAVGSTDKAIPYIIAGRADLTLETMAGRKFGVGRPNSLDHTLSWTVLQYLGAKPDKIEFVPLGQPNVRGQALAQGRIDATTMSIGVFTAMPDRADLKILVDVDTYFSAAPIVSKVNVVPRSVIAERANELDAVLEALTMAARDYAADPGKWVDAMTRARPDTGRDTLEELAKIYAGSWTVNGGLQRKEMDFTQVWLYRTEKYDNKDLVLPGAWGDFAPVDRVLKKIGISDKGDPVSR